LIRLEARRRLPSGMNKGGHMQSMAQLLSSKGSHVWSISPEATVFEGLELMAEKNIGALLIVEDGRPVGIMSERDYARKIILEGRSSRETKIKAIMTTRLVAASPDDSVEVGMAIMTRERIRHLPIVNGDSILGMVSIGDLVRAMIDQQQFTIEQLERYIST
jgi:CBS domain-containing protein